MSTPCKAFGHTDGRYAKRACKSCTKLRAGISEMMVYWFNRIILKRLANDSHIMPRELKQYYQRKLLRAQADIHDTQFFKEVYGGKEV